MSMSNESAEELRRARTAAEERERLAVTAGREQDAKAASLKWGYAEDGEKRRFPAGEALPDGFAESPSHWWTPAERAAPEWPARYVVYEKSERELRAEAEEAKPKRGRPKGGKNRKAGESVEGEGDDDEAEGGGGGDAQPRGVGSEPLTRKA